jgi:hypothetical protein
MHDGREVSLDLSDWSPRWELGEKNVKSTTQRFDGKSRSSLLQVQRCLNVVLGEFPDPDGLRSPF